MSRKWYSIKNLTTSHTDIYIYDEIGCWGYKAADFANDLANVSGDIVLHINSPGGDVYDGLAIFNLIKSYSGKVEVIIEGLAASITSVIALAGSTVKMAENSMFMIHSPWTFMAGDSEELQKAAQRLDTIEEKLVNIYVAKTKLNADEITTLVKNETWFTAEQALEKGFIDEITATLAINAKTFDGYNFQNKTKYSQYLNKIKINKPKKEGESMEEILKALNVSNQAEALTKIKALQNSELALKAKVNEQTIETAIQNKQIFPSQKGFALNLLNQSTEMYNQFIEGNKIPDLTTDVDLGNPEIETPVNVANVTSFEQLLNDEKLLNQYKKTSPQAYAKLYNEYYEGE